MKTMRLLALTIVLAQSATALMLTSCATKPNVRSDYDHAADFSKYHTFDFVAPLSLDKAGYSSLVSQQLKSAVTSQMQQRGYMPGGGQPDLLVNFSGNLREKTEVQSSPTPYYGYRAGYYSAWPGYTMGSDVYTVNYTEGTLNVDMIDARTKRMVWEGVVVGEVTKKHLENREAALDKAVAHIFAKFPFQAGVAKPTETAEK